MRIRQILLIHPTRPIRALINKYIFTELTDIEIVETDSWENALAELNMRAFNIVIFIDQLIDTPAADIRAKLAKTKHNTDTPFIVLTESESEEERDELIQQGFEHVVQIRISPADLIQKINRVCNPREWRKDKRYHIPKFKVTIDQGGVETEASLINLSMGGISVELTTHHPDFLMKNDIQFTLRIPTPSDFHEIPNLTCKLSRLNVTEWHPDNSPSAMRAAFVFVDITESTRSEMEQFLRMANEDKLMIEEIED